MRPELPWNVAGIPPEAREAARAAARREGLSVGEWLTRRILRSFSDAGEETDAGHDEWRNVNARAEPEHRDMNNQRRDTSDMLARVSRSEDESNGAYRRIEDQLRTLARRLDAAERSHSENNRAMSKAAAEINVASREQTQAFDQLGAHVVGLSDRLDRVERHASDASPRDAVKGLQQGLSRLADQLSQTAHESTAQIASLAGNVESLANKLVQARHESESAGRTLEQRIYALDDRLRATEKAAQASADTLEKAVQTIEARSADKTPDPELQRHAAMLAGFGETIDRLTAKLAANETQTAHTLSRMEESIAKLEGQGDTSLDGRLQGIQRALGDIASRLDTAERNSAGAAETVEDGIKALTQRVDASEKRSRDAIAELRSAFQNAADTAENYAQPPHVQALTGKPGGAPMLDLPPFSEPLPTQPASQAPQTANPFAQAIPSDPFATPPRAFDAQHGFAPEPPAPMPAGNDAFAPQTQPYAGPTGGESYLAAARRAARTAAMQAEADRPRGPMGAFTWGTARADAEEEKKPTRYVFIAGLALVAIIAAVAGVMLSQRSGSTDRTPSNGIGALLTTGHATPPAAAPKHAQTNSAPVAIPGSPVIPSAAPANDESAKHFTVPFTAPHAMTPVQTKPVQAQTHPAPVNAQTNAAKPAQQAAIAPAQRLAMLANQGNAGAQTALGLKYLDGDGVAQNDGEAARWFERAAAQNQPVAEYRLGTLYERGRGVKADPAKATHWYDLAAKNGNRKAMHNLAVAFAEGAGEKKDFSQAARWFSQAANLGLADSQFNLAVLYERGLGVPQSLVDAYKWYAIAASQGDTESKARIEALATQLSAEEKSAAQKAAATFKPQPMNRNANVSPDIASLGAG